MGEFFTQVYIPGVIQHSIKFALICFIVPFVLWSEFISATLAEWADENRVHIKFIQPGKPTKNSYVERFNRTYRTEVLDMHAFKRLSEIRKITENWIREYNEKRPHDSLDNLTSSEYFMGNSV